MQETVDEPFRMRRGRLYGATMRAADDEEPVRFSFLGDHRDVYELIGGPIGLLARQFDAAVVATTGWAAPLDDVGPDGFARPSLHPDRYRVRACCAVGDAGVFAVMRTEREPSVVVELGGAGSGAMPEALLGMWSGGAARPARATWADGRGRRPATRHRRPA